MADDSVQPVPWVLVVSTRGRRSSNDSCAVTTTSTDSGPVRWPPFTSTTRGPLARIRRAAERMSSTEAIPIPERASASGTFGVRTRVCGISSRLIASMASSSRRRSPPVATDDVGKIELHDRGGDRFDNGRGRQHADLDGAEIEICGHRFDLCRDEVGRHRLPGGHAKRVLRRDGRDGGCPEDAMRSERLQVGLNPRAATGVAARNCQCCAHTVRFEPV